MILLVWVSGAITDRANLKKCEKIVPHTYRGVHKMWRAQKMYSYRSAAVYFDNTIIR
jgi:hypothetical protein